MIPGRASSVGVRSLVANVLLGKAKEEGDACCGDDAAAEPSTPMRRGDWFLGVFRERSVKRLRYLAMLRPLPSHRSMRYQG